MSKIRVNDKDIERNITKIVYKVPDDIFKKRWPLIYDITTLFNSCIDYVNNNLQADVDKAMGIDPSGSDNKDLRGAQKLKAKVTKMISIAQKSKEEAKNKLDELEKELRIKIQEFNDYKNNLAIRDLKRRKIRLENRLNYEDLWTINKKTLIKQIKDLDQKIKTREAELNGPLLPDDQIFELKGKDQKAFREQVSSIKKAICEAKKQLPKIKIENKLNKSFALVKLNSASEKTIFNAVRNIFDTVIECKGRIESFVLKIQKAYDGKEKYYENLRAIPIKKIRKRLMEDPKGVKLSKMKIEQAGKEIKFNDNSQINENIVNIFFEAIKSAKTRAKGSVEVFKKLLKDNRSMVLSKIKTEQKEIKKYNKSLMKGISGIKEYEESINYFSQLSYSNEISVNVERLTENLYIRGKEMTAGIIGSIFAVIGAIPGAVIGVMLGLLFLSALDPLMVLFIIPVLPVIPIALTPPVLTGGIALGAAYFSTKTVQSLKCPKLKPDKKDKTI